MDEHEKKGQLIDASGIFEQKRLERPNDFDMLCEIYAYMQICLRQLSPHDALKVLKKLPTCVNTLTRNYRREAKRIRARA